MKSLGNAYLIWVCVGFFGIHRLYLGAYRSGAAMLALPLLAWTLTRFDNPASPVNQTIVTSVFPVLIVASVAWMAVDAVLMPGLVRRANA